MIVKVKCGAKHAKKKHNTLVHRTEISAHVATENDEPNSSAASEINMLQSLVINHETKGEALLATALLQIKNGDKIEIIRALIDPASQGSFITEVQRLNLYKKHSPTGTSGLGGDREIYSKYITYVNIKPCFASAFESEIEAVILKKLTRNLPNTELKIEAVTNRDGIVLADPKFNIPAKIDMILGVDAISYIILPGLIQDKKGGLFLRNTELGWIVSGPTTTIKRENNPIQSFAITSCDDQIQKFWTLEEINENKRKLTQEEELCEFIFENTHSRDDFGRYIIKLPFKSDKFPLGKSRDIALARLFQMEKKFEKNAELKNKYIDCMNDYIKLGHMKPVITIDENLKDSNGNYKCYYMPHHAVFKQTSNTTKLRVVFDASRKSKSGFSLNDNLCVGPTIQDDLFNIFVRWRKYKYVFTADIEKMYRQIMVHQEHQDYQRILWREDPHKPVRDYCLTTATFGTAYASHSSIRSLQQLAADERDCFPIGSRIIKNDFYVDNLLSGADNISDAIEYVHETNEILKKGQFALWQWASNDIDQHFRSYRLVGTSNCKGKNSVKRIMETENRLG